MIPHLSLVWVTNPIFDVDSQTFSPFLPLTVCPLTFSTLSSMLLLSLSLLSLSLSLSLLLVVVVVLLALSNVIDTFVCRICCFIVSYLCCRGSGCCKPPCNATMC